MRSGESAFMHVSKRDVTHKKEFVSDIIQLHGSCLSDKYSLVPLDVEMRGYAPISFMHAYVSSTYFTDLYVAQDKV